MKHTIKILTALAGLLVMAPSVLAITLSSFARSDASGNAYHLTQGDTGSGTTIVAASGKYGLGVRFDGVDSPRDYLFRMDDALSPNAPGDASMAFFSAFTVHTIENGHIFRYYDTDGASAGVEAISVLLLDGGFANEVRYIHHTGSISKTYTTTADPIIVNQAQTMLFWRDAAVRRFAMEIDGVEVLNSTWAGGEDPISAIPGGELTIGSPPSVGFEASVTYRETRYWNHLPNIGQLRMLADPDAGAYDEGAPVGTETAIWLLGDEQGHACIPTTSSERNEGLAANVVSIGAGAIAIVTVVIVFTRVLTRRP